jgi:hypothetical protein
MASTVYPTDYRRKITKRRVKVKGSAYRREDGRVVGEYENTIGKKRYFRGRTKPEVSAKLRKFLDERDRGVAYDSANFSRREVHGPLVRIYSR